MLFRIGAILLLTFGLVRLSTTESAPEPGKAKQVASKEAVGTTPGYLKALPDSRDDAERIQQAIDSGVGAIRLGKGTFRLSRPLEIRLDEVGFTSLHGDGVARLQMHGAGPAIRFVGTHGGTAAPHTVKPNVWDRQRTPLLDGLEIVGDHPEADGVQARGTMQLTLSRLTIRNCRHAVHLTERNRNVILSECHLYENHGKGLFLDHLNLHQINVCNCHISYNKQGGIVSLDSEIRNLQIGTCDIEGNMGDENDPPSANVLLDGSNSSLGEVTIIGCTIQHAHEAVESANIRINGTANPLNFTEEDRHGHITIADNVLSDVQFNLDLKHCRSVTITGNTIWKGYSCDLRMSDCKDVVLASNVFDRNPRYHYGDGQGAKLGLQIENCQDCLINGNMITGTNHELAAVQLRHCDRMNITSNSILEYGRCGILMEKVTRSRISDCLFDSEGDSDSSITLLKCDGYMLRDNYIDAPVIGAEGERSKK
ncbi:MAG: hypothetical protein CMJ47_09370 [Planctomyces sp.]|nr:hypothetical protein [Planctomyces sp.]